MPPFVGRDRELRELQNALESAVAGRGRLILISGEAGIGKTRLCEELVDRAAGRGDAIGLLERSAGHVHLDGLDIGQIPALVKSVANEVDAGALHHHTGGNPLFALELARLLAAQGSPPRGRRAAARAGDGPRRADPSPGRPDPGLPGRA